MPSAGMNRIARGIDWIDAPAARLAHPNEDHLLPLVVVVGAAEDDFMGSMTVSSFRFGVVSTDGGE
jgi:aromatic ring-opening dioxygenase catalytic subunit (LigB family)